MNEDAKSKLKEKMGAVVSDEDLEKVVGGADTENAELLAVLDAFHPKAVKEIFRAASFAPDVDTINIIFNHGASTVLKEVLGDRVTITPSINDKNKYTFDGKEVSHTEMKKIILEEGWVVS